MNCFFCRGTVKDSTTDHVVRLKNCIVIIKDVPCEECSQCGETYYSDEVAEQLENIINKVKDIVKDIAIFEYTAMTA